MLARDAADELTPASSEYSLTGSSCATQRLAPLDDDPAFFPVRRADQAAPAADVRLRGLDERIAERSARRRRLPFQIDNSIHGFAPAIGGLSRQLC